MTRARKRIPVEEASGASPTYRQLWRIVDGAVDLALTSHPEYLAPRANRRTVRNSIVKRVVGAINGYAEQSAWVRSGFSPADENVGDQAHVSSARERES